MPESRKLALLIGVSEYGEGLEPLSAPPKDVEAIKRVLENHELGGFESANITTLIDPNLAEMREKIEDLFTQSVKQDLVLLYFSGHGITDDNGRLYLTTRNTSIDRYRSRSVPASFIQDLSDDTYAKRQIIILDCCYSGAFAEGWRRKGDIEIELERELGKEGRVVLTSSSSTQVSFQRENFDLSLYTQYLVEGIETGAADTDKDGMVKVRELHSYAKRKVREVKPKMKPDIIVADDEGYEILVSRVRVDATSRFRELVEKYADHERGEIRSKRCQEILNKRATDWNLHSTAKNIIDSVLEPSRQRLRSLELYRQEYEEEAKRQFPLGQSTLDELRDWQQAFLGLEDRDVELIQHNINNIFMATQEIVEICHTVECEVQGYSDLSKDQNEAEDLELISIANTIQLLRKDLSAFKDMVLVESGTVALSFLENWAREKLDKIVKPLLLNRRYIDILCNFEPVALEIKERMQNEARLIGFSVEQIVSVPNLKHLELKRDFVLEDAESAEYHDESEDEKGTVYLTNDAIVKVKINTTVTARIENFGKIAEYLSPDIEIKALMIQAIRCKIREYLNHVTPERYYTRFYHAGVDEQGNPIEMKSVEQELKEVITAALREGFGAKVISVVPRPIDTPIVKLYRELIGREGSLEFEVLPLKGVGDSVKFYADFQVLGIEKNSWYIFQSRMESMQMSHKDCRLELLRLKDIYKRKMSEVIDDNDDCLSKIQEKIRLNEAKLSGIYKIQRSIENAIIQRLRLLDESVLAYKDWRTLEAMEKAFNNWAQEAVKNQYGLEIIIENLRRDQTLEEKLKAENKRKQF